MNQKKFIELSLGAMDSVPAWYFTQNYIMQYNTRIFELRDKYGCECKHGPNKQCKAKKHIISIGKGSGARFYKHYGPIANILK